MKFGSNIHGPQMMNPPNFSDPLTFPLAPPTGQSFDLFSISWHKTVSHYMRNHQISVNSLHRLSLQTVVENLAKRQTM